MTWISHTVFIVIILLLCKVRLYSCGKVYPIFNFTVPKYTSSPDAGEYNGVNIAVIDVDFWHDTFTNVDKVFVTTPRQRPGTPASLSTVVSENSETLLAPYPSWSAHQGTCDGIISAFRTQVDECDRLWVIDTGVMNSATAEGVRICPPKILIYNLLYDELISTHEMPDSILAADSLVITIKVDVRRGECEKAFAYMADTTAFQIIVFDASQQKFWAFQDKNFFPFPLHGTFNINNVSFDFMDGILGMALSPYNGKDRTLYFHSLASVRESCVSANILRNESLTGFLGSIRDHVGLSHGKRFSQSAAEDMSSDGILFYSLLSENAIACWPSNTAFVPQNMKILFKDDVNLQFLSGLKVYGDRIWALSSRLQNFFVEQVNPEEINYRVLVGNVTNLTRNTKCQRRY